MGRKNDCPRNTTTPVHVDVKGWRDLLVRPIILPSPSETDPVDSLNRFPPDDLIILIKEGTSKKDEYFTYDTDQQHRR